MDGCNGKALMFAMNSTVKHTRPPSPNQRPVNCEFQQMRHQYIGHLKTMRKRQYLGSQAIKPPPDDDAIENLDAIRQRNEIIEENEFCNRMILYISTVVGLAVGGCWALYLRGIIT